MRRYLQAMEVASNFVGETIPVIQNENNTIVGVVSEADIFDAYLVTQSRVHDLSMAEVKTDASDQFKKPTIQQIFCFCMSLKMHS